MTPVELKAFRHRRNLPQADLAEALGLGRTTIVALERGNRPLSRLSLLALAAYEAGLQPYSPDAGDLAALERTQSRRVRRTDRCPTLDLAWWAPASVSPRT